MPSINIREAACPACGETGTLCKHFKPKVTDPGPFDDGPIEYDLPAGSTYVRCRPGEPEEEPEDWANGGCGHKLTRDELMSIAREQGAIPA